MGETTTHAEPLDDVDRDADVVEDVDVVETWRLLVGYHRRTIAAMDGSLRQRCGHSLDEYDVLHQVGAHGRPIRMGELADRLLVANSSCHRIVGRLVDAGHLVRVRGTADRREVRVDLTGSGRRLRRRMAVVHTRDIERWFGRPLSTDEHRRLLTVFRRLERSARGDVGAPDDAGP